MLIINNKIIVYKIKIYYVLEIYLINNGFLKLID